jgi:aminopeptidase YwaD
MKKLFALSLFLFVGILYAQTDKDLAASTVEYQEIKDQIFYISSDELLGRDTGSEGIAMAADYIIEAIKSYGAKPVPGTNGFLQEVPLMRVGPSKTRKLTLNGQEYDKVLNFSNTEIIHNEDVVFLGFGTEQDFANANVKGKFVIVKAGIKDGQSPMELFNEIEPKVDRAKNAGAIGMIELAPINPMIWGFIENSFDNERVMLEQEDEEDDFHLIWVLDADKEIAKSLSPEKKANILLDFSGAEKTSFVCHNIVAYIEGTDPVLKNEYIIYGAHYDHVGVGTPDATGDSIYNGARDNAVGTVSLMQMAKNLGQYPTKRSALFIFFTGEELGLLGSNYYVNNPLLPLENMVYLLNSDNAGYNDTSLITIFGLYRTNMSDHFKTAASAFGLTAIDDPAPEQNLFDRSDNVNFAVKGIPAPTFSMGFTSFSGQLLETYHQPSDVAETIDYDYLYKFNKSYVLTGRLIANDPTRPFWTAGDKYEAAGKELYKK